MRLTSVELHPHGYTERAILSFRDPARNNPYNVKAIVGLDADEIVPRHYGGAKKYYTLSLEKREVIVRIALNPRFNLGETYSGLRDFLYKLVASTRTGLIHIHFKNEDTMVAEISGFITKVEAPHFNKEPEVQITVSCDDPWLRAMQRVSVDVSGLDPVLSNIQDDISTAPHGFIFEMEVLNPIAGCSLQDASEPEWVFSVNPDGGFLAGDVIHFSSEYNNRYFYLVRSGEEIHLADVITPDSVWPILFPGDNPLVAMHPEDLQWLSIAHYPTYWGV